LHKEASNIIFEQGLLHHVKILLMTTAVVSLVCKGSL
jgi:hypothetical protein